MINGNHRFGYELICDICGEGEKFDYVLKYKRDLRWKCEKYKDGWQDICPKCREEMYGNDN